MVYDTSGSVSGIGIISRGLVYWRIGMVGGTDRLRIRCGLVECMWITTKIRYVLQGVRGTKER